MPLIKVKTFNGVNGPYLTKYRLLKIGGLGVYIHRFHRGDEDPDCHDHPFSFLSLVLSGGYREHREDGTWLIRGPFSLAYRDAFHRHRVELLGRGCWTLCITRNAKREWGFYPDGQFVHWEEYIRSKGLESIQEDS